MLEEVEEVYNRIKKEINLTPVVTSTTLNKITDTNCYLKMENYQRTGSFKIRGALNAINCLSEESKTRGVTTHSSGNFAQALSLASTMAKVKATVVMPENAPKIKVDATKSYGAEVVFCGIKPGDREEVAQSLIKERGYTLIHSSNDMNIIYGQSTVAY